MSITYSVGITGEKVNAKLRGQGEHALGSLFRDADPWLPELPVYELLPRNYYPSP